MTKYYFNTTERVSYRPTKPVACAINHDCLCEIIFTAEPIMSTNAPVPDAAPSPFNATFLLSQVDFEDKAFWITAIGIVWTVVHFNLVSECYFLQQYNVPCLTE